MKERGPVVKLASVIHSFAHSGYGAMQGSGLGFYFLPTGNTLVTTTTFIYRNVSWRELTHKLNSHDKMKRGAA